MNEKFSRGTINSVKTNKQTNKHITTLRDVLCQTIQKIRSNLDLLMYDSPDHGLNTNAQIFEAVHAYLAATTRFI